MKRTLFFILAAVSLLSCSKGDDGSVRPDPGTPPEKPQPLPEVKIATADNGKNVFEIMQFKIAFDGLNSDGEQIFYGFYLDDHYDSLVWNIPAHGLSFKVYEHSRWTSTWGNCFFTPGKIDTRLAGYREGKEIYSYEYPVTVNNNKDFLCFDWVNVRNSRVGTGYHDIFTEKHWNFATSQSIHDGVPSVSLYIFQTGRDVLPETRERELLFNLIGDLYGEPVYGDGDVETDARTTEKYGEFFHFIEPDSQPLSIWVTERSKIVLLRMGDDKSDPEFPVLPLFRYNVYAEPY
jgi:hypothetical protein